MRNNPYPDDPISAQPTEVSPNIGRMEDLQPRPVPPPVVPVPESIPEIESVEVRQEEARTVRYAIGKLNDFLQWFVAVLEVTLAIRFIFKLINADQNNLFAGFIYALTSIISYPFMNIVHQPSIQASLFEWSTLIAMAIYWLAFWAIRRFLRILITNPDEAES